MKLPQPYASAKRYDTAVGSFAGGINRQDSPILLKDNQCYDIVNFQLEEEGEDLGALRVRAGYTKLNTVTIGAKDVNGLATFYTSAGGSYLVCGCGTKLYSYVAGVWTDISHAVFADGAPWYFATYRDTLVGVNGIDHPVSWTSAAAAITGPTVDLAGAPHGKYIICEKERLFIANISGHPSRVEWSDAGTLSFAPGYYIDINENDGSEITGITVFYNTIYVFKNNAIYRLTVQGADTAAWTRVVPDIGCTAPRSIAVGRDGIYFLHNHNIYMYNGSSQPVYISANINNILEASISNLLTIPFSKPGCEAAGIVHKGYYLLAYQDIDEVGSYNNAVVAFSIKLKTWTRFNNIHALVWLVLPVTADDLKLYFGTSKTTGFVYKMFEGTNDDGTAITSYAITKSFTLKGGLQYTKDIRDIYVTVAGSNTFLTIDVNVDDIVASSYMKDLPSSLLWGAGIWGAALWGSGNYISDLHIALSQGHKGRVITIIFTHNKKDYTLKLLGYDIRYRIMPRREA